MAIAPFSTTLSSAAAMPPMLTCGALALIAGFIVWSFVGWRRLRQSAVGPLVRARYVAALAGFVPCLLLIAVAASLPPTRTLGGVVGLMSAVVFLAHCAADPAKSRFWHHRRLRLVTLPALLALGLSLGLMLSYPGLAPLLTAVAAFHRYQRGNAAMLLQALDDVEALKHKLFSLDALRLQSATTARLPTRAAAAPRVLPAENPHDRPAKAG